MLPPVAFGAPAWRSKVLTGFTERVARRTGLLEVVRAGAGHVTSLPIAQILEIAATVVVAAVVSTTMAPAEAPVGIAGARAASAGEVQVVDALADAAADAGAPAAPAASTGPKAVAQAPAGSQAAADGGLEVPQLPGVPAPLDIQGLLNSPLLPSAEALLSDPVGAVTGVVDSLLQGTITSTIDSVGVADVGDPLTTVQDAVDAVTGTLEDVPVVGQTVQQVEQLKSKLPGRLATPSTN
jgi:hypothetical protein